MAAGWPSAEDSGEANVYLMASVKSLSYSGCKNTEKEKQITAIG